MLCQLQLPASIHHIFRPTSIHHSFAQAVQMLSTATVLRMHQDIGEAKGWYFVADLVRSQVLQLQELFICSSELDILIHQLIYTHS